MEETDKSSRFLGVLKARDRKEEKLSIQSLKLEQKIVRERGKELDQSSIYKDVLERNERAERKLHGKRKQQRRKEHEGTGRSEGLGNVVDFKRQESEAKGTKTSQIGPIQKLVKCLKPKRKATVAAENWQQKLSENW